MRLSAFERRVLSAALLADEPITTLAKRLSVPAHKARYAINRLCLNQAISPLWVIDIGTIGWTRFTIFCSICDVSSSLRKRFEQTVTASSQVAFFAETSGEFDYELSVVARNVPHASQIVRTLASSLPNGFFQKVLSCRVESWMFSHTWLDDSIPRKQLTTFSPTSTTTVLSEAESKLLQILSSFPDLSMRDIARRLSLSASTLDQRLARLRAKKVVIGKVHGFHFDQYGASFYVVLCASRRIDLKLRDTLLKFSFREKHCVHFIECFGEFDFEFGVEVSSDDQLNAFKRALLSEFGENLYNVRVIRRSRMIKFSPYPMS